MLKELTDKLASALTTLFQSSDVVAADWRAAHVTPIFKKGEQYDSANYRPVSLASIVCKLLEHITVTAVMRHLEDNTILNDNQHGFRRGRLCETQLLELMEELMTNLECGKQTDVLIMDFSKAFDHANHSLLLHKLQHYGVQGEPMHRSPASLRQVPSSGGGWTSILLCQCQIRSPSGFSTRALFVPSIHK